MPAFKGKLGKKQINQIAEYIMTPAGDLSWSFDDIKASREEFPPNEATRGINPGKLDEIILIMEKGAKSLAVMKSADFSVLTKFYVGNVHGGPKFSPSLENIYSIARDGVLTKFHVPTLSPKIRLKAGINARSLAVSHDDRTIAVANYLPSNIVFFNDNLDPVKEITFGGKAGGFYNMLADHKFILTFRNKNELWMIDDTAPYAIDKHSLPEPFEDISICPTRPLLIGTKRGSDMLYIYNYKKREVIAKVKSSGLPHLASAAFYRSKGELFVAINHIKKPFLTIYSLDKLKHVEDIELSGAGFFVRSHKASPWLWVDTFTDSFLLVSKQDLSKRRTLTPRPGRQTMHVEFTTDGLFALVTMPGKDGSVIIYDSNSLEEVKSIPFNKPMGKYNAVNKTYPERVIESPGRRSDIEIGKDVFDNYCMGCHHQIYEAFGPPFAEIAEIRTSDEIRRHITSPEQSAAHLGYARNSMSTIKLTKEQIDGVVSYIMSFKQDN